MVPTGRWRAPGRRDTFEGFQGESLLAHTGQSGKVDLGEATVVQYFWFAKHFGMFHPKTRMLLKFVNMYGKQTTKTNG